VGPEAAAQVGIVVIRAWAEPGPERFRARIIHTLDVTRPELSITLAASTREDVHAAIRVWLEALIASQPGTPT
jgi:hypothetical protein